MPAVSVNGTAIFYRLDGSPDAPIVILSSSLGTTHAMWEAQLPALIARFRVLRYDTRGHGASAAPPGRYDLQSLARDALGLLDELGIERASFCGLSLGGMTGMWLAAHAPERIERLVVASSASQLGTPETWNARIEAVRRGGMAAIAESVIERWFTPEFRRDSPAPVERIRQMLLSCPAHGYAACAAAVRDMDQRGDLASIPLPTLVICGSRDPATPPEHSRLIAERVPGARLVELSAAHLCNIEAEQAFNRAVLEFLE
jgi:3-oxoadipate enol-lactonase